MAEIRLFTRPSNIAKYEEVIIKRRGGETFSIIYRKNKKSPFDIPGINTKATTEDILSAIRESRELGTEDITTESS
jgi:hypothetical protein